MILNSRQFQMQNFTLKICNTLELMNKLERTICNIWLHVFIPNALIPNATIPTASISRIPNPEKPLPLPKGVSQGPDQGVLVKFMKKSYSSWEISNSGNGRFGIVSFGIAAFGKKT